MRIVFMGTPEFAVPSLEALAAEHDVTLVVTRPDAVRSRGKRLEPSPVKARALELGLPVLEAKRMDAAAIDAVRDAAPDLICVVAFGCILPDELLAVAPLGAINVHGSLLPRWRGAAPIRRRRVVPPGVDAHWLQDRGPAVRRAGTDRCTGACGCGRADR